jgi:glycosyltransferase involved in cell wall biosynthesis
MTRYDSSGASSRVRVYQFIAGLAARGIDVDVAPLFDARYLRALYSREPTDWFAVGSAYMGRVWRLLQRDRSDLLWIEYELLPWIPWMIERPFAQSRTPYVVEYDDAVFHRYDMGSPLVRALLGTKLDRLMASAACVIAGNEYLASRARAAGAARVEVVPSVVDLREYSQPASPEGVGAGRSSAEGRPFTVGWLGSPSTTRYVRLLASVFARLAASGPLRVVVVGGTPVTMPGVQVEQRPWSKDTEAGDIAGFDVGVMPLEDSPWERGKCGYKLIQYMAGGVPVVASPVGVNAELAVPEVTGLLASSDDEWVAALGRLRNDPALRRRLGEAGRALVERRYSLDVATPRLAKVLTDLVPSRASVL